MTDSSELLAQVDEQITRQRPDVKLSSTNDGTRLYTHGNRTAWAKAVQLPDADLETGVEIDGVASDDSPWRHLNQESAWVASQILRSLEFDRPS